MDARLANAFGLKSASTTAAKNRSSPSRSPPTTSAGDLIAAVGNLFKLIIYDEVHHSAPSWGETALMSPARHRLGLTATYPGDHEQEHGRWRVADLIGPIVYEKQLADLVGKQLAEYRTERSPGRTDRPRTPAV